MKTKTKRSPPDPRVKTAEPRPLPVLVSSLPGPGGKDTLQNQAYGALKEAVISGRFRPGEVVTIRALSELLGAGAMPVREALRRLTSEGAFEAMANRSARIPRLSRLQVEQILELRLVLEGKAAAQAAANMSLRQLDELRALQDSMEDAINVGDHQRFTMTNKEFHFTIYRIADNEALLALIEALWLRMAPVVSWVGALAAREPEVLQRIGQHRHLRMLKAFQARDSATAEREIQGDILDATKVAGYWETVESLASSPAKNRA